MGADALARDGQSDFPALQRRIPVPGIGPDEHHGLAIPAPGLAGRAGVSLLLAGRRQQEFGVSVPRRAVCGRNPVDRARHRPSLVTRTDIFTRRDTQFLLFFAVSYAAWLAVFSIQRYAIVLELLCAPLIVLLISRCMAGAPGSASLRASSAARECGDACRCPGRRIVVATGRLVPPSLVQSVQPGHLEIP